MIDITELKNQLAFVVEYSQDFNLDSTKGIDTLVEKWQEAKSWFINRWNSVRVCSKKPVTFTLSVEEQESRIDEYVNWLDQRISHQSAEFIDLHRNGFFNNTLEENHILPDGSVAPKGSKLLKLLKFYIDDKVALEDAQNMASRVIQENKIEGYLYMSVHPLDYLSSSENTYNWRSCHALDGEYRAGNLSYMMDSSTVVCYLASKDDDKKLPHFPGTVPWNSKKWRMLLHFSNDRNMLFAGRQYPFFSDSALGLVSALIESSFEDWHLSEWHKDKMRKYKKFAMFPSPLLPVGSNMRKLSDIVIKGNGALNYNDILHSSCYDAYYCYRGFSSYYYGFHLGDWGTGKTTGETQFVIGEKTMCLNCGNSVLEDTESFFCSDCNYGSNLYCCDNCGGHFNREDIVYVDGYGICPQCYDDHTAVCGRCGERHFTDTMKYNWTSQMWECNDCLESDKITGRT